MIQKNNPAQIDGFIMPVTDYKSILTEALKKDSLQGQLESCNVQLQEIDQSDKSSAWFGAGAAIGILSSILLMNVK